MVRFLGRGGYGTKKRKRQGKKTKSVVPTGGKCPASVELEWELELERWSSNSRYRLPEAAWFFQPDQTYLPNKYG